MVESIEAGDRRKVVIVKQGSNETAKDHMISAFFGQHARIINKRVELLLLLNAPTLIINNNAILSL